MMYYFIDFPDGKTILKIIDGITYSFGENDFDNKDCQEYLEWVAQGNTAEPLNLSVEQTQE